MTKNLKTRIYTSIILFSLLFVIIINNYILGYSLILVGVLSFLEFSKIIQIIFKQNYLKKFFWNLIFMIYIFSFCSIILVFSFSMHLKIMIFLILLTCISSDIGGYIFGKFFKGPKLSKISPNKTISGALGSLILSSLCILLLFFYLTKNFDLHLLFVGIITSIGCQIGDLFFSFLKRKSFLKDTGNWLPGHGGILDRIDGILIGMPTGFITLLIIF
jgi:phosphatidate cytidylyltransferase